MTKLYLIRHGQTDFNVQGRYSGSNDVALNQEGIRLAQALKKRLDGFTPDAVYSSDLRRAVQTAEIIFPGREIIKMNNFRELNFGEFEGLTYSQLVDKYPGVFTRWMENPGKTVIPGGEAFDDFAGRIRKGMSLILSQNEGKTVVLVSHGGPARVILGDALGYGPDKFWEIHQENTALNILDYTNNTKPVVELINDTRHLTEQGDLP